MINYESIVNAYGERLGIEEKVMARRIFNDLLAQGRDFEWICYAIANLRGRSPLDVPHLMFYRGFQAEVDILQKEGRELLNKLLIEDARKYWRFNLIDIVGISEEEFETRYENEKESFELGYYSNILGEYFFNVMPFEEWDFATDFYNQDDEYQQEHKQKIIDLFFYYCIKPSFMEDLFYERRHND